MNAEALIGKVLGTCTLQEVIGQGGMGAVYLAQQKRPSSTRGGESLVAIGIADSPSTGSLSGAFPPRNRCRRLIGTPKYIACA